MMKVYRFFIVLITVMLTLALSNPTLADRFTDTIEIYKKAESAQPFLKTHTNMRFSRLSERAASVSEAPTVKVGYTRVARSPVKPL